MEWHRTAKVDGQGACRPLRRIASRLPGLAGLLFVAWSSPSAGQGWQRPPARSEPPALTETEEALVNAVAGNPQSQ